MVGVSGALVGPMFLLLAWAYVTGLMSSSFWYQLEETIRQTASEPNNGLVVSVKFLLWGDLRNVPGSFFPTSNTAPQLKHLFKTSLTIDL